MASYSVNDRAIVRARRLIDARRYVLDSDWGEVQPRAHDENAFLKAHTWDEYAEWHLGLNEETTDETKSRYAFVLALNPARVQGPHGFQPCALISRRSPSGYACSASCSNPRRDVARNA